MCIACQISLIEELLLWVVSFGVCVCVCGVIKQIVFVRLGSGAF